MRTFFFFLESETFSEFRFKTVVFGNLQKGFSLNFKLESVQNSPFNGPVWPVENGG